MHIFILMGERRRASKREVTRSNGKYSLVLYSSKKAQVTRSMKNMLESRTLDSLKSRSIIGKEKNRKGRPNNIIHIIYKYIFAGRQCVPTLPYKLVRMVRNRQPQPQPATSAHFHRSPGKFKHTEPTGSILSVGQLTSFGPIQNYLGWAA